jgi:hypothetical protein
MEGHEDVAAYYRVTQSKVESNYCMIWWELLAIVNDIWTLQNALTFLLSTKILEGHTASQV